MIIWITLCAARQEPASLEEPQGRTAGPALQAGIVMEGQLEPIDLQGNSPAATEAAETRPRPVLRPCHQPSFHWIGVHVTQGVLVLLHRPHDLIEIAGLPKGSSPATPRANAPHRSHLYRIHHLWKSVILGGNDQGVPVVRHENVPREEERPARADAPDRLSQTGKVRANKGQSGSQEVAGYEENLP